MDIYQEDIEQATHPSDVFPDLGWETFGYKSWNMYFDNYGVIGDFEHGFSIVFSEDGYGTDEMKDTNLDIDDAVYIARGYDLSGKGEHESHNRARRLGRIDLNPNNS